MAYTSPALAAGRVVETVLEEKFLDDAREIFVRDFLPGAVRLVVPEDESGDGNELSSARQQFRRLRLDRPRARRAEKRNRLYRSAAARLGSRRRAGGSWSRNTSLCSAEMICDTGSATARSRAGGILKLHGAEDDSDAETPFPSEDASDRNLRRRRRRRRRVALGAFGPLFFGAFAGNVTLRESASHGVAAPSFRHRFRRVSLVSAIAAPSS